MLDECVCRWADVASQLQKRLQVRAVGEREGERDEGRRTKDKEDKNVKDMKDMMGKTDEGQEYEEQDDGQAGQEHKGRDDGQEGLHHGT